MEESLPAHVHVLSGSRAARGHSYASEAAVICII